MEYLKLKNGIEKISTCGDCPCFDHGDSECNFEENNYYSENHKLNEIPKTCPLENYIEIEQSNIVLCGAHSSIQCEYRLTDNSCSRNPKDCIYGYYL